MKPLLLLASAATALAAAPAFAQPPTNDHATLSDAAETPLRDLNIVKDKTPPVLQDAKAAPYAHVAPQDCVAMRAQIADLDKVLGPDLDDANYNPNNGSLLTDAVHSALELPFDGVVRRITGAKKEEQERDRAILAGYTRRAYLKGALMGCEARPALAAAAESREGPDVALAPPRDDRPLTPRDAAVDASGPSIEASNLPPPSDAPAPGVAVPDTAPPAAPNAALDGGIAPPPPPSGGDFLPPSEAPALLPPPPGLDQ